MHPCAPAAHRLVPFTALCHRGESRDSLGVRHWLGKALDIEPPADEGFCERGERIGRTRHMRRKIPHEQCPTSRRCCESSAVAVPSDGDRDLAIGEIPSGGERLGCGDVPYEDAVTGDSDTFSSRIEGKIYAHSASRQHPVGQSIDSRPEPDGAVVSSSGGQQGAIRAEPDEQA